MNASLLIAAVLLLSSSIASACQAPVPKGMTSTPVGDNVVVNGRVMAIAQVQGPDEVKAVLEGAARQWKELGHEVRLQTIPGWQVLSGKSGNCLVTLQVTSRKGTFGYLARSKKNLTASVTAGSRGVPLPGDAKVASSVASVDDGRRGLVVSMTSPSSLDELNSYFLKTFHDNKWESPRSHKVKNTASNVTTLFLNAQRGRERVEIVAWDEGSTQIMMTISDSL
jgi:hypothetical protein